MADLDALTQDKDFMSASPQEKAQYLREVVLPKSDPEFAKASPQEQESYLHQVVLPKFGTAPLQGQVTAKGPGVIQGVGNVLNTVGKGLVNAGQAAINPQTYTGLASEAGNALQTEIQNNDARANRPPEDAQTALNNALPNLANRITGQLPVNGQAPAPDALDLIQGGGRQIINGITGIPADIANAYQGKPAFHNDWEIPESPREAAIRKNYPVSSFVGDQLPYAIPIAGEGNLLRTAAEGAGIGALQNGGDGLSGRVANAAAGAAIPTALKAGGRLLQGRLQFERALPVEPSSDLPVPGNAAGTIEGPQSRNIAPETINRQAELEFQNQAGASQSPNAKDMRGLRRPDQQQPLPSQERIHPEGYASTQQSAIPEAVQTQSPQNQLQTKIQNTNPQALQNLHASVDDFNVQPTKNYQSLARKTRDLAHHLTEDEFDAALGKLSQQDMNEVGRLLGC